MDVYVKSTSSKGLAEYAWYKAVFQNMEPSESPLGSLDENLQFYYSGSCDSSILYCSSTDLTRRDSWNRPIRNKLYIRAARKERPVVEQLASSWLFHNREFVEQMNAAYVNRDSGFIFCSDWLSVNQSEYRSPKVLSDTLLPVFISFEEVPHVFAANDRPFGKNVRILAADSLSPSMTGHSFVCITENMNLEKEWANNKKEKNKKHHTAVIAASLAIVSTTLACGLLWRRKK